MANDEYCSVRISIKPTQEETFLKFTSFLPGHDLASTTKLSTLCLVPPGRHSLLVSDGGIEHFLGLFFSIPLGKLFGA